MPGVLKVFTADDFAAAGGIPCGWQVTDRVGQPMKEPKHPVLAEGKVRHVGDPVAAVVAETLAQARDAAEAIELEIEELPAVVDMRAALAERLAEGPRRDHLATSASTGASSRTTATRSTPRSRPRRTSPRSSSSTTA